MKIQVKEWLFATPNQSDCAEIFVAVADQDSNPTVSARANAIFADFRARHSWLQTDDGSYRFPGLAFGLAEFEVQELVEQLCAVGAVVTTCSENALCAGGVA